MFAKKKKKGFTLIELLVVIAIIGILAGIVLVSLSGAQKKAKDGRIMADMNQLRTVASLFYDSATPNTFTGLDADADEGKIADDVAAQGGTYAIWIDTEVVNDPAGSNYCATATLPGGGVWCVDSELTSEKDINGTLVSCVTGCEALGTCECD